MRASKIYDFGRGVMVARNGDAIMIECRDGSPLDMQSKAIANGDDKNHLIDDISSLVAILKSYAVESIIVNDNVKKHVIGYLCEACRYLGIALIFPIIDDEFFCPQMGKIKIEVDGDGFYFHKIEYHTKKH